MTPSGVEGAGSCAAFILKLAFLQLPVLTITFSGYKLIAEESCNLP